VLLLPTKIRVVVLLRDHSTLRHNLPPEINFLAVADVFGHMFFPHEVLIRDGIDQPGVSSAGNGK